MTIDIEQLRAELATKHHIVVHADDPVFAVVWLNDALLSHFAEKVSSLLEGIERKAAGAFLGTVESAQTQVDGACKTLKDALHGATLQIPDSAKAETNRMVSEAVRPYARELDARGAALSEVLTRLDQRIATAREVHRESVASRWISATVIAGATGIMALLMSYLGVWLAR